MRERIPGIVGRTPLCCSAGVHRSRPRGSPRFSTLTTFDTPFGAAIVSHTCANDGVVEGIKLVDGRAFSVQYHPEAAAGPHDANYLFDQFVDLMAGVGPQPARGKR